MSSEDGSVVVLLNGEIYNFRELRDQLRDRGHRFRTTSDTEVIVHGYTEWGLDLATHLDGMFAFAVWDEAKRRLLLGRDRVGKKPLFLYEDEVMLAFSSELKSLLEIPEIDLGLNPSAVPPLSHVRLRSEPGHVLRKDPQAATCFVPGDER